MEQPRVPCDRTSVYPAANAGGADKVASIRSVHGKRLTSSAPVDNLFRTQLTTNIRPVGSVHLRTNDDRPVLTAQSTAGRSSVECRPLPPCLTQHAPASDDNRFSSSGSRVSTVGGIVRPNDGHWENRPRDKSDSSRAGNDNSVLSCTPVIEHSDDVESGELSEGRGYSVKAVCPSPRSEFARRRRPTSAMDPASRVLPVTPQPRPPPPATKPRLPNQIYGHRDTNPTDVCSDRRFQIQQPPVVQTDADFTSDDVRRQNADREFGSHFTRDRNSVAAARSSPSFVPATRSVNTNRDHAASDRSVLKSSVEAPSTKRTESDCEVLNADGAEPAVAACADVARRLNQLKTFYDRKHGHQHLRPGVTDNGGLSTAANSVSRPADVVNRVTPHPHDDQCIYQQDTVVTKVTPLTALRRSVLAKFDTSQTVENGLCESAVSEDVVLPPPPEFDDSFPVPPSSCFSVPGSAPNSFVTAAACDTDCARTSGVDGWSVDEVCSWLDAVGFHEHCASFRVENVHGARLRTLGRSDLIALGMTAVHDRMNFERALRKVLNS